MAPTVWFMRHAESTFNASKGAVDDIDCGLTPAGRAQAAAVAASPPWPRCPTHVYVSPLRRAQDTIAMIRPVLGGAVVHTLPLLREFRIDRCDTMHGEALGVETEEECATRTQHVLSWLREEAERHGEKDCVLLVGHGDLFHAVTDRWLRNAEAVAIQLGGALE